MHLFVVLISLVIHFSGAIYNLRIHDDNDNDKRFELLILVMTTNVINLWVLVLVRNCMITV